MKKEEIEETSLDTKEEIKDGSLESQILQSGKKKKQNGSKTQSSQSKNHDKIVDDSDKESFEETYLKQKVLEEASFDDLYEIISNYIFSRSGLKNAVFGIIKG